MLQNFSWTQFFLLSAVLTLIWYALVLLTAYRKECFQFLKINKTRTAENGPAGELPPKEEIIGQVLIGQSKLPPGMEKISSTSLCFESAGSDNTQDQLGLVPDVLEELKQIFEILAKEDGTKQDFFALAAMISEKYGRIGSNPNISHINAFIRDRAPFAINPQELDSLWD